MDTNIMLYYNGKEIRIEEGNDNKICLILPDGTRLDDVEPRMLLPVTNKYGYISIVDDDGNEKCIIRNIWEIPGASAKYLERALERHYLIPKITEIKSVRAKFGLVQWEVITDRGSYSFEIQNRYHDIKLMPDGRVLVRDSNDNRYEILDIEKLPRKSQRLLAADL
jgi:hypothetical protein